MLWRTRIACVVYGVSTYSSNFWCATAVRITFDLARALHVQCARRDDALAIDVRARTYDPEVSTHSSKI